MENKINAKLKILKMKWDELNDEQRWKALAEKNSAFKSFKVMLDNDDTFLVLKKPREGFEEEFYLGFDEYIGWSNGIQTLLKAINIKAECV